jgi:MoaA/NifB/PqqE/SkfB family radical SAM enzyme
MKPTGIHLLLSFQCTRECDHCFVWGSPHQRGLMSGVTVKEVLEQAKESEFVERISFGGGEPFLHYPILLSSVRMAARMGFRIGVSTNAYWAGCESDCAEWLGPLAGLVEELTISSDWYHWEQDLKQYVRNACAVGQDLGIEARVRSVVFPGCLDDGDAGDPNIIEDPVEYRGRASIELAPEAPQISWLEFKSCRCNDLRDPEEVQVDPYGNVHVCQGITVGNLLERPLSEICAEYEPELHPVIGPLIQGGPVELVLRYGLDHKQYYADACHVCYDARLALRGRFPEILAPEQMYGVPRELDPLAGMTAREDSRL